MARSKWEVKFQGELKVSSGALLSDAFMYKIPDMPRMPGTFFIPEKPFDMIFAYKGKFVAIENKVHTKHTAWPVDKVKDHQVESLKKCKNNGMDAFILVNVRYGRGKSRINFVAIIDVDEFIQIKKKQKSVKVDILQAMRIMQWIKLEDDKYYWNIGSLF